MGTDDLTKLLDHIAPQLITGLTSINPILGAALGTAILAALAYLAWKTRRLNAIEIDKKNNETVSKETASDQKAAGNVQDRLDDFLNGR